MSQGAALLKRQSNAPGYIHCIRLRQRRGGRGHWRGRDRSGNFEVTATREISTLGIVEAGWGVGISVVSCTCGGFVEGVGRPRCRGSHIQGSTFPTPCLRRLAMGTSKIRRRWTPGIPSAVRFPRSRSARFRPIKIAQRGRGRKRDVRGLRAVRAAARACTLRNILATGCLRPGSGSRKTN